MPLSEQTLDHFGSGLILQEAPKPLHRRFPLYCSLGHFFFQQQGIQLPWAFLKGFFQSGLNHLLFLLNEIKFGQLHFGLQTLGTRLLL